MSQIMQYVEDRLLEWGAWAKKTELPRLSYKSNSDVVSILGVKVQSGGKETYDDASAEEMEKLLLRLAGEFKREERAIVMYYATNAEKPLIARKMGVSVRTLSDRLKSGKTYLAGCLAHKVK